ncbi:MAG: protein-L-isoaspartate(D-aspartate) O-methyltransferase [Planctomycetota bacterium]|nr:protein-L-isoaspartate(D-aspartate) O-methyltransferase [Planctomycetota bacterium]
MPFHSLKNVSRTHRFCSWIICTAIFAGLLAPAAWAFARDFYREARLHMVKEYIEGEGISDRRVLESMRSVPRHEFVPSGLRKKAYMDQALPIGHQQTISPPFIVAYMTQTIEPQENDIVLEIGTGSGYQAAVLSSLVEEVFTIEIVEELGQQAGRRLDKLGYDNVHSKVGDGYLGWPEHAPFDKIIVTCSPEDVPTPLVDQLREGGKMLIPLGERYQQVFHLFEKKDGELVATRLIPTLFVPMTGKSEDEREIKPDPLHPKIVNGGFELDENEDGRADGWHYQRQTEIVEGTAPQGDFFLKITNDEPGRAAQILQGTAVDGERIGKIRLRFRLRLSNVRRGPGKYDEPGFTWVFYDKDRRTIRDVFLGPWTGSRRWTQETVEIPVPPNAKEMIFGVGLLGGTGEINVDEVEFEPLPR